MPNDPQAPSPEAGDQPLHGGGFPGSALSVQEHVVRRIAPHELLGVRDESLDGALDPQEVVEIEQVRLLDGDESPRPPAHVPPKGEVTIEHRGVQPRPGDLFQGLFAELEDALQAREEATRATHDDGL